MCTEGKLVETWSKGSQKAVPWPRRALRTQLTMPIQPVTILIAIPHLQGLCGLRRTPSWPSWPQACCHLCHFGTLQHWARANRRGPRPSLSAKRVTRPSQLIPVIACESLKLAQPLGPYPGSVSAFARMASPRSSETSATTCLHCCSIMLPRTNPQKQTVPA